MKASRILSLLLLGAGLGACALLPKHHPVTKVTAISTPVASTGRSADVFYESAVRAINARRYAEALDQLEAARLRDANDIRVLNAFGVVYDKLGRFDVSARYYAQAAALDPTSWIVKQNLAYSELLQHTAHHDGGPALAAAAPAPALAPAPPPASAPVGRLVQVAQGVVRIEGPFASPTVAPLARGITGHPLALVDASGGTGVEPLRARLTRLGWTAPRLAERAGPIQPLSRIIYAENARVVALALARTLPQRVDMQVCADSCQGVQLVLGRDSATWRYRGAAHRV